MSLNQTSEHLNDAFEEYFPALGPFRGPAYNILTRLLLAALRLRTRLFGGRVVVNERIVEYPQILRWVNPRGVVLDIGCVSSRLPIQLASLGYEVHGVDPRPYPFQHANFHFHQADIFDWSPDRLFDIIILVSTLDHFGLGVYGDRVLPDADKKAVKIISEWLSENGQLLVTVPFGKACVTERHRVFDMDRLRYLFSSFEWVNEKYCRRAGNSWLPCPAEDLRDVPSPGMPPNGVALLNLRRN
jgi:SAM-dependent methyltransferase